MLSWGRYWWSIDNPSVRSLICGLFARKSDFRVSAEAENGRDLMAADLSLLLMKGLKPTCTLNKLVAKTCDDHRLSPHGFLLREKERSPLATAAALVKLRRPIARA